MNYVPLTTESKKGLMCNKDMEPYYICTLVHIFASCGQASMDRQVDKLLEEGNKFSYANNSVLFGILCCSGFAIPNHE